MGDTIRKDAIIEFINNYDNEVQEECYKTDVSNDEDYKVSTPEFYDIVARHNVFFEKNGKSPLIISIKKDGKCTGDYIQLDQYQDMWSRYYTYTQVNGEDPNYVSVVGKHVEAPAPTEPPASNGRGKEMHTASDNRWSYRTGYTNPIKQVNSYDCSVHSCLQVIYAMTGNDLSEDVMVSTALGNGWLDYSGAGHWQLEQTLQHFSNGQLKINWVDFSSLGFNGLFDILNDPQRDFIVHGGINCSDGLYGHYFNIRQSSPQLGQLSELRSICGAEQEYILWENDFRNRINYISQPSIGIVTYS
jgi:hypothetical protein